MAGRDTNIGAKRARDARTELGIEPAAPVACLLTLVEDDLGIPVNLSAMPEGIEGLCWQLGDTHMLWVNAHEFVPRSRFTLAHELGHLRCGHDGSMIVDTFETMWGKLTTNLEVQANAFAAEFLAPAAGVRELVGDREPTLARAVDVSARYGISTIAAAYRFSTLGLVESDKPLKARIDAGDHLEIWAELVPEPQDDSLAAARRDGGLPRLSPLLGDSAMAALLRGDASVEDVAAQVGCDATVLAESLALLGV